MKLVWGAIVFVGLVALALLAWSEMDPRGFNNFVNFLTGNPTRH
jgi:hypothetical protein